MQVDALVLAGDVAALLEEYGVVACGRRQDGATRIDFWSHTGKGFHCAVTGAEDPTTLLRACLQIADIHVTQPTAVPPIWS
jgi:hypothetical protein